MARCHGLDAMGSMAWARWHGLGAMGSMPCHGLGAMGSMPCHGPIFRISHVLVRSQIAACRGILTIEPTSKSQKAARPLYNGRRLFCFQALFNWRDKLARELDESKKYVMSSALLFVLSESSHLYRLYIGIADGVSIARVGACRYSK